MTIYQRTPTSRKKTTPFNMVRAAMEHFNIPCDLIVCDRMRKSWPFKHCERHIEIEK
jgi:hypothetical protein